MQSKCAVLLGVLCLVASGAFASIARVSPAEFPVGGEDFLTIYGTDLAGTSETWVVFDGQTVVEPQLVSATAVVSWVPVVVLLQAGQHTVEVRSVDGATVRVHGPASFTVAVPSVTGPPLLGLPEVIVAEATSASGAHVTYGASAISLDGTPIAVNCSPASGSLFPLATSSVQCSATDSGGTTTGRFIVVVTDTAPPVLTLPSNITSSTAVVTFTATAVDAIDGAVPVSCSPSSGSTFPTGTTHVRCTATDAHLNPAGGSFDVTVTSGAPLLTLPDDIEVEAAGPNGTVVNYTATAANADTFSCSPASGSTFPLGSTTVNCSATNASGTTTGSFVVTVVDTTPPSLSLPSSVTEEATGPDGATVTWTATASDLVDGIRPVTCVPASGTLFALGTTTVICTASDTRSNEATGSFDVVVQDTTGPQIVSISATPNVLWPPNHQMIPVQVQAVAIDAVDPSPTLKIISVSSNQPVNGTGDGDTAPDWKITGPMTLQLRAERAGNTGERVYTIVVEAQDGSGNSTTATVQVMVRESKRRVVH